MNKKYIYFYDLYLNSVIKREILAETEFNYTASYSDGNLYTIWKTNKRYCLTPKDAAQAALVDAEKDIQEMNMRKEFYTTQAMKIREILEEMDKE